MTNGTLRISQDHIWVQPQDNGALMGISDFAAEALGTIIYVELPEVGEDYPKGEPLGIVESVKSSDEIMSPITGEVTEVNSELEDSPEMINQSPFEDGWLCTITIADESEFDDLMDTDAYRKHMETL